MTDRTFMEDAVPDYAHIFKYDEVGRVYDVDLIAALPVVLSGQLSGLQTRLREQLHDAPLGFSARLTRATSHLTRP